MVNDVEDAETNARNEVDGVGFIKVNEKLVQM